MLSFFNNPVSLAILTVAAIGFLVYEIIDNNRERQQQQQYRRSGPPPPPPYGRGNGSPPRPPQGRDNRPPPHARDNGSPPPPQHGKDSRSPPPPYRRDNGLPPPPPHGRDSGPPPPPPHGRKNGPPPPPPYGRHNRSPPPPPTPDPRELPRSSASPENTDIRKRKPKKRSESESEGLDDLQTETVSQKTVISDTAKENSTSSDFNLSNPDINCINKSDSEKTYEKKVLSETTDSNLRPKNKVRRRRSFKKSVSDSAESSESSSLSKKLTGVSLHRNNALPSHSGENKLSEETDESGKSNYTSDSCLSSTDSMLSYKRNVCEKIQNDIAKSTQHDIDYSSSSSPESNVHEDPAICESDICRACQENRVNTRTEPCNHRYLCYSCARRIHRIYKKCGVCHCHVMQFRII